MATKLIKKGATLAAIVAALSLSSCKKEDSTLTILIYLQLLLQVKRIYHPLQ